MRPSSEAPSESFCIGHRLRRMIVLAGLLLAIPPMATGSALAQADKAPSRLSAAQQQALRGKVNEVTLLVATSAATTPHPTMVQDIAAALGADDSVRLLPVAGGGGHDTLRDLLFLRGMDMAIVPANVLSHAKSTESPIAALQQRIAYITPLYSEELHVLVGRSIRTMQDLAGKKIAVPPDDGNAQFTVRDLMQRLGVSMEVVRMAGSRAVTAVQSGELAAALVIGGKPLPLVSSLPKDGSLRLLDLPFSRALEEGYAPAVLRAEDYPSLIPPGVTVETLSVSAVLVTNNMRSNEESYRRVARFVPVFFSGLTELNVPQLHPKWREVNLGATLSGWVRFPAAQEWLDNATQQQADSLERSFEEFLRTSGTPNSAALSPAARKRLFEEFVKWTRKSVADPNAPTRR